MTRSTGRPHAEQVIAAGAAALLALVMGCNRIAAAPEETMRETTIKIYHAATGQAEDVAPVVKSDQEWRAILTPEQYDVLRRKGTEQAFSKQCAIPPSGQGIYQCAGCGTDLFAYGKKFESGTGWPSFFDPVSPLNIRLEDDSTFGMRRVEVNCARCGGHLGHVFDDGPPPTGKRYCINTVALTLKPREASATGAPTTPAAAGKPAMEIATFAGGCFWGIEKYASQLPGVVGTRVGYTGGTTPSPTYEQVCTGKTGHAEAIEITYDSSRIRYADLVTFFFTHHDPTTKDRQGNDVGTQYRSAVFYHTPQQREAAAAAVAALERAGIFKRPVVTEIAAAGPFYAAEARHQQYLKKNPNGYCAIQLQPAKVAQILTDAAAAAR